MTDIQKKSDLDTAAGKANQLWGDFVPVIGFVLTYNVLRRVDFGVEWLNKDTAIYWATGLLIALTAGFIASQLIRGQKVSLVMVFTSVIIGFFGLLGILLQEKSFIYIKATLQQLFMAGVIFIPMFFGRNLWRTLFSDVFNLPDHAWRVLSIRWGLMFIAMALWNEYLWRTYAPGFEKDLVLAGITIAPAGEYHWLGMTFGAKDAEDVWANWKLGNMLLFVIFGALNVPYTLKHLIEDDETGDAANPT